jgi:hypothetical protein
MTDFLLCRLIKSKNSDTAKPLSDSYFRNVLFARNKVSLSLSPRYKCQARQYSVAKKRVAPTFKLINILSNTMSFESNLRTGSKKQNRVKFEAASSYFAKFIISDLHHPKPGKEKENVHGNAATASIIRDL